MTPFFSIGVTTYNRRELLKQTLLSILDQSFKDFEVIVGNDYTQETLSPELFGIDDPRVRFVNHPENLGEVDNMNALLGLSRGRYFTWQADDDLYAPEFLSNIHEALTQSGFPACAFSAYGVIEGQVLVDETKLFSGKTYLLQGGQFIQLYLSGKVRAIGTTGVYEVGYLKSLGGVQRLARGNFALYSEYLLLVQSGLLKQMIYIDKPLVLYRNHAESWGCTNQDAAEYKFAGDELLKKGIEVLRQPSLRQDFRQNLLGLWKLALHFFVGKAPNNVPALIDIATVLKALERVPEATAFLKQALTLEPSNLDALMLLGRIAMDNGCYKEAGEVYLDIVHRTPTDLDALLHLGRCMVKLKDFDRASTAFERVLKLESENASLMDSLGVVLFRLGDFGLALQFFLRVTALRPNDASAFVQLALTNLRLERVEDFEAALGRALELDPFHREALKLLAELNFQEGNWKDAGQAYAKILNQSPEDLEALLALGNCFLKADEFETARVVFEKVLQVSPNHPVAGENLSLIQRRVGRAEHPTSNILHPTSNLEPAARPSSDLRVVAPNLGASSTAESPIPTVAGLLAQADAEHQKGNFPSARRLLLEAVRIAPDDCEIIGALGIVAFGLNDFDLARGQFERLTQLKPDDPTAFLQLAIAHLKLEHIEEFETALARALELDPYHLEALRALANLNFQHGSLKNAAQTYTKILSRYPDDIHAMLPLGVCFFKTGDLETAKAVFQRALEVEPGNTLAKENLEAIRQKVTRGEEEASNPQHPTSSIQRSIEGQADLEQMVKDAALKSQISNLKSKTQSSTERVNELVDQAHFFSEAGNREAALESLEEAAELAPSDSEILAALGSMHFTLRNHEIAREKFRRVIELRPRDPDPYTRLAMACLKLNRIEEMESALGIALEIDPENREALKFLGKTNLENNRVRDAGRTYAKLLEKSPEDLESLLTLALCFYRGGDMNSAQMVYERVLELDPANSTARENLVQLGFKVGKAPLSSIPSPVGEASSAHSAKSEKLRHWLAKADAAFAAQNLAAACEALKVALELSPDTTEILSALGTLCFQLGDMAQARTFLRRLVQNVADDPSHWARLALTHYRLGETAEFEVALGRALELDPNHLEALRMLAHLNFNHGSAADAAQQYGKILKQTPDDLETIMALGVCFFKVRDFESAKMMFERAIELDPQNTLARENLETVARKLSSMLTGILPSGPDSGRLADPANLQAGSDGKVPHSPGSEGSVRPLLDELLSKANELVASGDTHGACDVLRQASGVAPNDADIFATLGSLLFQLGDGESSQAELARAVRLRPDSADFQTRLAISLLALDRISDFESALSRALELDANYVPALRLLADLNLRQGKFKDGADLYFRILRRDPDNLEVILAMAVCFYKTGDIPAARLMYERVLKLEPGNAVAKENIEFLLDSNASASGAVERPSLSKPPVVSAIVSTYNSERFMRGCLEDLEAQTIADRLEIIVIDSGSQQNERAIVEEFQSRYDNIVYVRTEERETVYAAWNRGIRAARGKYLTNANSDDRHRKDAFEILVRTLDEHPKVALVYADVLITDQENSTFDTARRIGTYNWLEFDPGALVQRGCFVGPQPMWRHEVHQEHGFFDPTFVSAGDYEFWMRLAKTREFLHVPQTLGLYLKSPTSVEHSNQGRAAEETRIAHSRHGADLLQKAGVTLANSSAEMGTQIPKAPPKVEVPRVASIGSLKKVHDLLDRKKYLKAWNATLDAINLRPFHPDAYLQMVEIALSAGDERQALICAERLLQMTPHWDLAKKVYASLHTQKKVTHSKIKWTPLPSTDKPRLSVCLIVKNEERFIKQCLDSVKPIATQIVVVDTGSTDRTVAIAKENGAEVYYFEWNDNFSDARNAAHEHAIGDWVLILDADEEMPVESHQKLTEDMAAQNVLGYRIPICNVHESLDSVTYVPRLFRNAPALFFVGRVHEQIYASVIVRKAEWGMEAILGTGRINHHGYEPALVKERQKVKRNLKLMERAVEEMPDEAALLMNYGLDLVNDGRLEEGLEKYRLAVAALEPHQPKLVLPEVRERLLTLFGVHLLKAGNLEELLKLMTSRMANDAGPTASMSFLAALALMRLKRAGEAIPHIRGCLAKRDIPALTPACQDILKAGPYHLLAECLATTGQNDEAEKEFKRALELDPRAGGAIHDYARFLHKENRSLEALQILHNAIGLELNEERIWCLGGFIANSKPDFLDFGLDWTGEAIKYFPEHEAVTAFRGEILFKAGQFSEALPFFQHKAHAHKPSAQAATILCQLAMGERARLVVSPDQEANLSRELLAWYRRLLVTNSKEAVLTINARLAQLRETLPTAAALIEQSLAESKAK